MIPRPHHAAARRQMSVSRLCFLFFSALLSLLLFSCEQERAVADMPSPDAVHELVAEKVNMLEGKRSGPKRITGKKCRELLRLLPSYHQCRVIGENRDRSATMIQVGAAYNGVYLEITLPVGSGRVYAATVSADAWNRICHILDEAQQ